jgi:curved DNA-binding protein CbpA
MSIATHYTSLGLVPTAAPEVIRAAYKALALVCHPDKTMHLAAEDRASHAAAFKDVQAAYDVLGNPSLKAAYDAELERHANKYDQSYSTLHHHSSSSNSSGASPISKRRPTVKMTTPEEKTAMRAKTRQSLEYLREKRSERDVADAQKDVAALKDMVHTWEQLAEENRSDPVMHAHCAIRIHEYEQKIAEREQQHKEWLANLSTAKQESSNPTTKQRPTTPTKAAVAGSGMSSHRSTAPRPQTYATPLTTPDRSSGRAKERERAEAERIAASTARAEARHAEKAQREAAKQAHLDQKAAAVRAEKEKQQAKASLHARQDAERIAKARAKAGAAPLGTVGAVVVAKSSQCGTSVVQDTASKQAQTTTQRICSKCGVGHVSVREWLKCNAPAQPASDNDDQMCLRTG